MTSLMDRPITAASDYGVCRWHAAKLWQTRANCYTVFMANKDVYYYKVTMVIEIKSDLHHKLHNKFKKNVLNFFQKKFKP